MRPSWFRSSLRWSWNSDATLKNPRRVKSGTFNLWIDRDTDADVFSTGTRRRWGSFEIDGETCVLCSDGPTLTATVRMGLPDQVRLFRIPLQLSLARRHLITIGWSKGVMKVIVDSQKVATIALPPFGKPET